MARLEHAAERQSQDGEAAAAQTERGDVDDAAPGIERDNGSILRAKFSKGNTRTLKLLPFFVATVVVWRLRSAIGRGTLEHCLKERP
jgi:hypothetical protein